MFARQAAKFSAWKANKVELQTKDGRKILVALDAFTAEDAAILRKLIRDSRVKK